MQHYTTKSHVPTKYSLSFPGHHSFSDGGSEGGEACRSRDSSPGCLCGAEPGFNSHSLRCGDPALNPYETIVCNKLDLYKIILNLPH